MIATDPAANATAHEGDPIGLTVSSGKVTLTDLVGQSIQAATGILAQLQLSANPHPTRRALLSKERSVHSQSLPPGDVPQGSTVTLTYCTG